MNAEQFIQKAQTIHGNKFGYANVIFGPKVQITCFEHGDFLDNPSNHLYRKSGCPKCANELAAKRYSSNTDEFIQAARNVHGDCYDYSQAVYKTNGVKVSIQCIKHNVIFEQTPGNHLGGQGCLECGLERWKLNRTTPLRDYLNKSAVKHNNRYDYTNEAKLIIWPGRLG
jgi:predicted  nucleic acid-binding Zn-ribbon protein